MEMSTLVSMRKVITLILSTFTLQIKLFLIICYWNEQSGFFNIENAWKSYFLYQAHKRFGLSISSLYRKFISLLPLFLYVWLFFWFLNQDENNVKRQQTHKDSGAKKVEQRFPIFWVPFKSFYFSNNLKKLNLFRKN